MTRTGLGLLVGAAVLSVAGFWGCGDDSGTGGSGGAGGSGSTTKSVSSASKATATVTGVTTGPDTSIYVGRTCLSDSDCGMDGRCLLPEDTIEQLGNGGPADGYCTLACTDNGQCPGDGLCFVDSNDNGICLLGCEVGPALMYIDDPLLDTKCHAREDVRCVDTNDGAICVPTCGDDAQCPAGRVCDPRIAICVDDPSTGLPDGVACDPMADPPECEGVCVNFSGGTTMCSNRCVLGGEIDTFDCGGLDEGVCVFRPNGYGPGDQGFCSPACSVQSDCNNPTWWCFSNNFAPNGFCFSATPCPNGQSDCTDSTDLCTQTIHGPFCLDPVIPLGSAGTGGGGGGTGGAGGAGGTGGTGGT